jgi:hypothetical protein
VTLMSQGLELVSDRVVGRDRAHRVLTVQDAAGTTREVIWWRGAEHRRPEGRFDLAYRLKASDYRGERQLQIEYVDARLVAVPEVVVEAPVIKTVDYRHELEPNLRLQQLRSTQTVAVWAEGYRRGESPGLHREQLGPAENLLIWTPPPGPKELRAVIEQVSPSTVYLMVVDNPRVDPAQFMPFFAGLIKYAVNQKQGLVKLDELAALTGQRLETVRQAVAFLHARGDVEITEKGRTRYRLGTGDGQKRPAVEEIQAQLQALLQETAAYRRYYARAPAERLV